MSMQNYQDLDKLRNGSNRYKVRGRITRLWESVHLKYNDTLSLEFLLLDPKGADIHVVLLKKYFGDFHDLLTDGVLKEGNVYTMEKFDVWLAKDYRPVKNEHKIFFNARTVITPDDVEGTHIARHKFNFSQFDTLLSRVHDKTHLIDVIGLLKRIGEITQKNETTFREIVLMDQSAAELTIALWGALTEEFPDDLLTQEDVVIIATSLNPKDFQGQFSLSSLSGTKVYIDLDTQAVIDYKNSLGDTKVQIAKQHSSAKEGFSEEELLRNRRVSVDKLKEMGLDESNKGATYTCKATIGYVFNTNWYYTSCTNNNCNKKVVERVCPNCNLEIKSRNERYLLRMDVEDSSGVTQFVAFDREAEYLIQKPVKELVDTYKKKNGPQIVQDALQQVAGKEFIFQVKINYFSRSMKESQSFVIYKIFPATMDVDDPLMKEIIDEDPKSGRPNLEDGVPGKELSSQDMESELHQAKKTRVH